MTRVEGVVGGESEKQGGNISREWMRAGQPALSV